MQRGDKNPQVGAKHHIPAYGVLEIVTVRRHDYGVRAFTDEAGQVVRNADGSIKLDDSFAVSVYECECKDAQGRWVCDENGDHRTFPGSDFTPESVVPAKAVDVPAAAPEVAPKKKG
jgi:hypothetical protein